jgi:threonine dehydrogenase-like Zn-dependent dehydrogenase
MERLCLWFEGGGSVSVRGEKLEGPGPGEVLVRSVVSAVSAGTEMLFYRGAIEEGAEVDSLIPGYRQGLSWPLRYGYATVGMVEAVGAGAPADLTGRLVFAFVPHASAFIAAASDVLPVPQGMEVEDAGFFASAETAVNLVLDTAPILGERVSVFGLGVIGLLATGLLARFPLASITGWDPVPLRREAAAGLGVRARDPRTGQPEPGTEDAAVEVSGTAEGFRQAVSSCGFGGRLIVGSWYGAAARTRSLEAFDTSFHRKRLSIVGSQVSTIAPGLSGRWTRERRGAAAWDAIRHLRPSRWITHRVPFARAQDAYRLLGAHPGSCIQVILAHGPAGNRQPSP